MKRFSTAVPLMFHVHGRKQALIGTCETCLFQYAEQYSLLQCFTEHGGFVRERSPAERVCSDRRKFTKEGMVVISESFRCIRHNHFRPLRNLVIGSCMERIVSERQRKLQRRELLVMESRSFFQRSRHHLPANG